MYPLLLDVESSLAIQKERSFSVCTCGPVPRFIVSGPQISEYQESERGKNDKPFQNRGKNREGQGSKC